MPSPIATILFCSLLWLSVSETHTLFLGRNNTDVRIIGGNVAFAGQFPYMAAIYKHTSSGNFFCGGALMSNQWILTAGSCVEGAQLFTIYLGTANLKDVNNPNSLKLATDEYVLHPDYNPDTFENDVGLIKLRMPITFSVYIRPFNYLPTFDLLPGTPGVVAMGWGQTSDDDPGLVDDLRFVYLTPLSNDECKLVYGNQIKDEMVCAAGNNNEGFCLGDSGTPLIRIRQGPTATHVGIASFQSKNGCESTDPSGYTRTLEYADWIRNVTGVDNNKTKNAKPRIIGGEVAFAGQFPYIAAIYKSTNTGTFFCGGALMNNQWILTSGYCVDGAVLFTIYLGAHNLKANDPNVQKFATDTFVLHPNYNLDTLENDIGVIKLRLPVTFTDYIKPIDFLPSYDLLPNMGGIMNLGWGQLNDETAGITDELHYVYLIPISNEECQLSFGSQILDTMVCAGGNFNEGFWKVCHNNTGFV
ncbi:serine protease H117 [Tribolium castaneum]|uniref:Serine protease H117 n=1 Tax=Tribolium castaneum TaxID=7070 RepID=D6WN56_TRICA|nr:serine protease H117 [Tribolium castaneum]